jgi:hypothetical protein
MASVFDLSLNVLKFFLVFRELFTELCCLKFAVANLTVKIYDLKKGLFVWSWFWWFKTYLCLIAEPSARGTESIIAIVIFSTRIERMEASRTKFEVH